MKAFAKSGKDKAINATKVIANKLKTESSNQRRESVLVHEILEPIAEVKVAAEPNNQL